MTGRYDFLVVGGGPAGCTFAILAARAGASVVLVERSDYSRRRAGEYIAGRVRGALDRLSVSKRAGDAISIASPGILSQWSTRYPIPRSHPSDGEPAALCVTRNRFDELLFTSAVDAGVTCLSAAKLVELARTSDRGWTASVKDASGNIQSFCAAAVIDASGRSSIVARGQGARRIHHGDLIAIAASLEPGNTVSRPVAMLTVEACANGWWSLSSGPDGMFTATCYTSLGVMKSAGAASEEWFAHALEESRTVRRTLYEADARLVDLSVYAAYPSRLSSMAGSGWIAIGDAAVAFDPIAGRGVAFAIDIASRAFERAVADPGFSRIDSGYEEVLTVGFDRHLAGRARVYDEARSVFSAPFLQHAVYGS